MKDGGPIFPTSPATSPETYRVTYPGISLLDWFAGQALVGLLSIPGSVGSYQDAARQAYGQANAMLAEREKKL